MTSLLKRTSVAVAVTLLVGCAARGPRAATPPSAAAPGAADLGTAASLAEYIEKVRHLSASAKPPSAKETAETLETRDPVLASDLLLAASAPTAERHLAIAERYRDLGVLDAAYRHFTSALALNTS